MSKTIYVVGHKNPDTDSVASAIAYAQLKNLEGKHATPLVSGKINKGTQLALKNFGVRSPKHSHVADFSGAKVILVDHNEEGQWAPGILKEKVTEVIDHHRVGEDFSTDRPIYVRVEPVGSTSTIICKMYKEAEKIPEIHVAGLLLSAILTDTVMFNSPSTTEEDKQMAKWLNGFVKIDMKKHAEDIFVAKSDITGLSTLDLIKKDFKEFHFNGEVKFGITMFETMNLSEILAKKEELIEKMKSFKKKEKLSHLIFVIVDIKGKAGYILSASSKEEELISKVFSRKSQDRVIKIPGIISRKSQIVPVLEEHFSDNS